MKLSVVIDTQADAPAAASARAVTDVSAAPELAVCRASANFVTQIAAAFLGVQPSRACGQRETEDAVHLYDEDVHRELKAEEHRVSRTV